MVQHVAAFLCPQAAQRGKLEKLGSRWLHDNLGNNRSRPKPFYAKRQWIFSTHAERSGIDGNVIAIVGRSDGYLDVANRAKSCSEGITS